MTKQNKQNCDVLESSISSMETSLRLKLRSSMMSFAQQPFCEGEFVLRTATILLGLAVRDGRNPLCETVYSRGAPWDSYPG